MDCSPTGSSVHGILQARILEWVTMPSFRVSSRPRDGIYVSYVSCIGRQVLYHSCHLGSPYACMISTYNICMYGVCVCVCVCVCISILPDQCKGLFLTMPGQQWAPSLSFQHFLTPQLCDYISQPVPGDWCLHRCSFERTSCVL